MLKYLTMYHSYREKYSKKNSIMWHINGFGFNIIYMISFLPKRIPNKDSSPCTLIKFILNMQFFFAKHKQRKTFNLDKSGTTPKSISRGDLPCNTLLDNLFIKYTAVRTYSPENFMGKLAWKHRPCATSKRWQCLCSTTLFWYVVPYTTSLMNNFFIYKKCCKSLTRNSVPLSKRTILMLALNWFLTKP